MTTKKQSRHLSSTGPHINNASLVRVNINNAGSGGFGAEVSLMRDQRVEPRWGPKSPVMFIKTFCLSRLFKLALQFLENVRHRDLNCGIDV